MRKYQLVLVFVVLLSSSLQAQQPSLDVTMVTYEADAVLAEPSRLVGRLSGLASAS